MSPPAYTEDTLVQQITADYLELEFACRSAYAGIYENIGRKWLMSYLDCFMRCHTTIDENRHNQAIYQ